MDTGIGSYFALSMNFLNKLWTSKHQRLGHLNNDRLALLFKLGYLETSVKNNMLSFVMKSQCESRCMSKIHVLPCPLHYS